MLIGILLRLLAHPSILALIASILTIILLPECMAYDITMYVAELVLIMIVMVAK